MDSNLRPTKPNIIGILDDNSLKQSKTFYGINVIGKFNEIKKIVTSENITSFGIGLAAVKHMHIKNALFNYCIKLGLQPIQCISNRAYISADTQIGNGQLVLPNSFIGVSTKIADNCSIHANVSILENCNIGFNSLVASNSFIGGNSTIEENVYIGPGCTIGSGVTIRKNSIVGAGTTIIKDIPENSMVYGFPNITKSNNHYLSAPEWMKA
jgi:sugar O-acyltransferase (sialic acid O-acetyltransferase NeuD family)